MALRATTSRTAVASRIHVTPDTLRKIELGISRPGSNTIEKMTALEIQPLDWFTEAPEAYLPEGSR
jgi:transcriptional regulator with XRE-family HTH domain